MLQYTREELETLHKERLKELLQVAGGYVHLAKMINVATSTTQGWENRGRISKAGAKEVGKNERLKEFFPAEYLRPDL